MSAGRDPTYPTAITSFMDWLNFHHLLYFWTVVRERSITKVAEKLHVSQPTVSGQLRELERAVGEKLYEKTGRELYLTETGRMVFEYAEEIFTTGQELLSRLKGRKAMHGAPFRVGIPDVMPKLVTSRLVEPMFRLREPVQLVCREAKLSEPLVELVAHRLDVVLSDSLVGSQVNVRAFHHLLRECEMVWLGSPQLVKKHQGNFPACLSEAPLLPTEGTVMRRSSSQWLQKLRIEPNVVAEIEDLALMKVLAGRGLGVVPFAAAIAEDAMKQHDLRMLGTIPDARMQFFAIMVERNVTHPAVRAVAEAASRGLFATATGRHGRS